mgnify:CR=1 FL=1
MKIPGASRLEKEGWEIMRLAGVGGREGGHSAKCARARDYPSRLQEDDVLCQGPTLTANECLPGAP